MKGVRMGWNEGFKIMEQTIISTYNKGILTKKLLDSIMEPYKETDCDSGGCHNLRAKDGLNVFDVICLTMEPKKYKDVTRNPDFGTYKYIPEHTHNNSKLYDLWYNIWSDEWNIW